MDLYSRLYPNLRFTRSPSPPINRVKECGVNKASEISRVHHTQTQPQDLEPPVVVAPQGSVASEISRAGHTQPLSIPCSDTVNNGELIRGRVSGSGALFTTEISELPCGATDKKRGNRGRFVKKYSDEDKKKMYLDRLSKMSIKKAQNELARVEETIKEIEGTEGDGDLEQKIATETKRLKTKMKLVNYAKFVALQNKCDKSDSILDPDKAPSDD